MKNESEEIYKRTTVFIRMLHAMLLGYNINVYLIMKTNPQKLGKLQAA